MTIGELFQTYGSFAFCIILVWELLRRLDNGKLVTGTQYQELKDSMKDVTAEAKEVALQLKLSQDTERERLQAQIDTLTQTVERMAQNPPHGGGTA